MPSWLPDGKRLAYGRDGHIWVMRKEASGQANITQTPTLESPGMEPVTAGPAPGSGLRAQVVAAQGAD